MLPRKQNSVKIARVNNVCGNQKRLNFKYPMNVMKTIFERMLIDS